MSWFSAFMLLIVLGLFMLVVNPVFNVFNNTTDGIIPNLGGVTDFEVAGWGLFMIIIPAIMLVMVIRGVINRGKNGG